MDISWWITIGLGATSIASSIGSEAELSASSSSELFGLVGRRLVDLLSVTNDVSGETTGVIVGAVIILYVRLQLGRERNQRRVQIEEPCQRSWRLAGLFYCQ